MDEETGRSRRGFLGALGAGVVGGVAGCSGIPLNPGGSGEDRFQRLMTTRTAPSDVQFNPFNPTNRYGIEVLYEPLAIYDRVNDEFVNAVAENWELGAESIRLNVDQARSYTNGDLVTARDVACRLSLAEHLDRPPSGVVDRWTVHEDSTIEVWRADPDGNDALFLQQLLTTYVTTPRAQWRDLVETLEETEPDSQAHQDALTEVRERTIGPDDLLAYGPFLLDSIDEDGITFVKNERHPSNQYNSADYLDHRRVPVAEDGRIDVSELDQGNLDYVGRLSLADRIGSALAENAEHAVVDRLVGEGLYFDHGRAPLGDYRVRQGLALSIDVDSIGRSLGPGRVAPPRQECGLGADTLVQNWLSDALDSFTSYGGPDAGLAAADLFRAGGLERRNGTWHYDGAPVSLSIAAPTEQRVAPAVAENVADALDAAGFDAEVASGSAASESFDLAVTPVGGAAPRVWHPYFYFRNHFPGDGDAPVAEQYEVPATVGDPDGATEAVRPAELAAELGQSVSGSRERDLVERLAWSCNQRLPVRMLATGTSHQYYIRGQWTAPDVETPRFPPREYAVFSPEQMLARGLVTPRNPE